MGSRVGRGRGRLLVGLLLACVAGPAWAGSIGGTNSIAIVDDSGSSGPVRPGDRLALRIEASFAESTRGGRFRLLFDDRTFRIDPATVQFGSFGDDVDFRCPTDSAATNPVSCDGVQGEFSFGVPMTGISGDFDVVSFVLDVVGAEYGGLSLALYNPFAGSNGRALYVDRKALFVEVVPEPTTAVLVGLGVAGLALRGRVFRRRLRTGTAD